MRLKKSPLKRYWFPVLLVLLVGIGIYYWFFQQGEEHPQGPGKLLRIYKGHTDVVWTAKFGQGDSLIASAGVDGVLRCWNREGRLIKTFRHPAGITHLAFSPDGKTIATSSYDEQLRIWDLEQETMVMTLHGPAGTIWTLAYSPDGRLLASGGEDKMVRIWDAQTGKLLRVLNGHERNIWAVTFSNDGKYLVSSGFDKTIRVWNAGDGRLVNILNGHSEAVVSLAFNDGGDILASGGDDGKINLWSFPSGKLIRSIEGDLHHVYGLDFQPGGDLLLSGHLDKPAIGEALQALFGDSHYNKGIGARLWNYKTGALVQTFSSHANDVNDVSWNSKGTMFLTSGSDKEVQLWGVEQGR